MGYFAELRRRQIFRLMGLYIVGAWLVIQVADVVFPTWGIPDTAMRYLFLAALLCFPIALIFGWFFDVTKDGIFRTRRAGPDEIIGSKMERSDYAILAALLAVGVAILLGSAEKIQEQAEEPPAAMERHENGIAVLPFDNLDENPETGYFSDGVTEEILSQLASWSSLHVIGRTSSFAFRNSGEGPAQISGALGVSYMLLGSVRRDRDLVRVTARLVDKVGKQVWTASFDRELENIFAIQSEIAQLVAGQIIHEIAPQHAPPAARATTNAEAYDAYLIARALFNARTPGWAYEITGVLTRAIELDPGFAPAYAILALSSEFRFDLDVDTRRENVCAGAQRAIDMAPNLAESNLAIGSCHGMKDDAQRQVESFRRAIELDPSFSMAYASLEHVLQRLGRADEARAINKQGLDLDPLNPVLTANTARRHLLRGEQNRAEQLLLRAAGVPEPAAFAYSSLAGFYAITGRFDEAIRWSQQGTRVSADAFGQHTTAYITGGIDWTASLHLQLGSPDHFEELHQLRNAVHFDEFDEFVFRSYENLMRGRMAELRLIADSISESLNAAGRELSGYESAELGIIQVIASRTDRGIELLEPSFAAEALDPDESTIWFPTMRRMQYYAYALQQVGRSKEATDLLHRVLAEVKSIDQRGDHEMPETFATMALCHGLLGNRDSAVAALARALELGWADYYRAINNPLWIKAFEGIDLRDHLSELRVELDRQRAAHEKANTEHAFPAELETILRNAGRLNETARLSTRLLQASGIPNTSS